ncbi:hypothetical protein GCM10009069_02970 [Algimonas arctica]|uniref:Uncharacterized protein n=1 Tax=Algimonas arctica TaxID=1479486 RepID=A0A8J3G163_9PROT|nr:hypothetical protein [Algimonas arctica]GHA83089.1 hypothetical protein GCM10009069_02970 [Algimonas arctica]
MRTGLILITTTALFCTGCATVDLQNMAGSSDTASTMQYESESNVVQRAVEKLRDAFASRGFGAKTSQRKMEAAADMLLNGLLAQTVSSDEGDYAATPKPVAAVIEDIQMARGHVEQTTRAAEVYLEVAPQNRSLDDELKSLEAALLASERATQSFQSALPDSKYADLDDLRRSVDALRDVTDAFGQRVRMSHSDKLAVDAASRVG